jgi:hypothetical protein
MSLVNEPRLVLRSLEHFCDSIEVKFLQAWGFSFKMNFDDVQILGLNHFPLFNYSNISYSSLQEATLDVYLIQG